MTEDTDNRVLRLKTLGNAVCPPQAYPIFQYIAISKPGHVSTSAPMEQEVTHLERMESPRKGGAEDDP